MAGASLDFILGITMHFAVQNGAFDRWNTPGRPVTEIFRSYSSSSRWNLRNKIQHKLIFLGDILAPITPLVVALLVLVLGLAMVRAKRYPLPFYKSKDKIRVKRKWVPF